MKKLFLIIVNLALFGVIIVTIFYFFTQRVEIFAQESFGGSKRILNVNIAVKLANELQTDRNTIKDLGGVIKKFHDNGIYVIARQTVFQDPELAHKKPEWGVKNSATGGLWLDYNGLAWMDPSQEKVCEL